MTDAQKKMIEKLGLTEQDFKPKEKTAEQRINELEEAFNKIKAILIKFGILKE